jgi:hypothetical protein
MLTEWMKPIKDFPGYWVTYDGRVWSAPRSARNPNGMWMKPRKLRCKDGSYYLIVNLRKNGKRSGKQIHRLVAEAYIPNPGQKPEVNHIDTDKTNNIVSNLEWNTSGENKRHAWDNGLYEKARKAASKASSKKVRCLETGEVFPSATEASKSLGFSRCAVKNSIHNNCKCGGYTWAYLE